MSPGVKDNPGKESKNLLYKIILILLMIIIIVRIMIQFGVWYTVEDRQDITN